PWSSTTPITTTRRPVASATTTTTADGALRSAQRPDELSLHATSAGGGARGRRGLCGHGHLRRPQGPGLHRRRREPRRLSRARGGLHPRVAVLRRGGRGAGGAPPG